jgi:probable HAF family extracellular repeat protein
MCIRLIPIRSRAPRRPYRGSSLNQPESIMSPSSRLGALLLALAASASASADPLYALNFLPAGFTASAINNAGQTVGTYGGAAAIFSNAGIASLAGVAPSSQGYGINDHGDVAGVIGASYFGTPLAWIGGALAPIGGIPAPYDTANATAINNAGTVIGNAAPPVGEAVRGYIYSGGSVHMIGTFGGDASTAAAINNAGTVVGWAETPDANIANPVRHAYVYAGGALQDLGTLGGDSSEAYDINDAGLVAGWSALAAVDVNGNALSRPFLYHDGVLQDLGSLGGDWGYARGLNNAGLVVGQSGLFTDDATHAHAFLYRDGHMVDLNALLGAADGWQIVDAADINDAGQILGTACREGSCMAVRLDLVAAVPEPASGLMLLAGLPLLLLRRRASARGAVARR